MLSALLFLVVLARAGRAGAGSAAPGPAYQVGGVTMLPLAPVARWVGVEIQRSGDTIRLTRSRAGGRQTLTLRVGSASATANGRTIRLERKVHSARGEVYVPVDLLSAGLGIHDEQVRGEPEIRLRDGDREQTIRVMLPRYPVVVGDDFLLGGRENDRWVSAEALAPRIQGGERYWLYSLRRYLGTATGSRPTEEMPGPYYSVPLSPKPPAVAPPVKAGANVVVGGSWNAVIALGAPWDAAPRRPAFLGTTNAVYQRAVSDVLRKHGLPKARARLIQVLRIDLEGDGTDEVLLTAQAPGLDRAMPYTRANDYSLVILRRLVGGKVRSFLLGSEFSPAARQPSAPFVFRVDGLLDLDGDGVLEILVADEYYEGMGMTAYQMRGGKPVKVLSDGLGA